MTGRLHLTIATPSRLLVETDDVRSLRATDASGSFGILPGHADFLTVLPASVVEWRGADGAWQYCAVRAAVFSVSDGETVAIACRQGVPGRDLASLEAEVRRVGLAETDTDRQARVEQTRLHAQAVRQLLHYLVPRQGGGAGYRQAPEFDL
jgi:F-type H+-transporting ATPase subunit epsilon